MHHRQQSRVCAECYSWMSVRGKKGVDAVKKAVNEGRRSFLNQSIPFPASVRSSDQSEGVDNICGGLWQAATKLCPVEPQTGDTCTTWTTREGASAFQVPALNARSSCLRYTWGLELMALMDIRKMSKYSFSSGCSGLQQCWHVSLPSRLDSVNFCPM